MKTFVYGDSFTNSELCKCPKDKMWYAPLVEGELVDRTRVSASTEEMFLKATNDAVNHTNARFIFGTGVMYSRVMIYTAQLYVNEQVRQGTFDDCLPYFDTQESIESLHVGMFHHTLVWSKYLSNIVTLDSLLKAQSHQWFMVHMNTDKHEYHSPGNPLVLPLLKRTAAMPNYLDQRHSCIRICKDAGIRPYDYDKFGWSGHHSAEGQQLFSSHVVKMFTKRGML